MSQAPSSLPAGRAYFGPFDRIEINGAAYRLFQSNEDGHVMQSLFGGEGCEMFLHPDLQRLQNAGRIKVKMDHFAPGRAARRSKVPSTMLSSLSHKRREVLAARLAWCQGFLALYEAGQVSKTHASVNANCGNIQLAANRFFNSTDELQSSVRKRYGGGTSEQLAVVSATSILNWVKAYSKYGLSGLLDKRFARGNRGSRFDAEEEALLQKGVANYLHPDRPSQTRCIEDTRRAFVELNEVRKGDGLAPLRVPSAAAIRTRIRALSPFEVCLSREGKEVAAKKYSPSGGGLMLSRPLERVEMDDWTVDLLTIARHTGLETKLPPEFVERLEIDGKKKRWHLCVAICHKTRCIVGMSLSSSATTSAAIQCLNMVVRDKGKWADAVGALDSWNMAGTPELLVTDCGTQFSSLQFQMATQDLGLDVERAVAGIPQLRGTIERLFRNISTRLTGRLSGRTFSDVVSRGAYPSEERGVLTVEEFTSALIRWVVDVYHNTPHEGLGGETPRECWRRLSNVVGVRPCPDTRTLRLALGERLNRKLSKQGLRILNLYYNNGLVMEHFRHHPDRDVNVRWSADNIGQIDVQFGDDWHTVPAVQPGFEGRSAIDWISAQRLIRRGNPHEREVSADTVARALAEIDAMNHAAGNRADLVDERLDARALDQLEQQISIGFTNTQTREPVQEDDGLYGEKVEPSTGREISRAHEEKGAPRNERKWEF